MIRRLAILFLIMAATGQAFASVCLCGDPNQVPACCKPKIERNSYLSRKSCCEGQNCSIQRSDLPAASLNQPAIMANQADAAAPQVFAVFTPSVYTIEPVRTSVAAGRYRYRPRAPDLYVRHHAFLI